jgi:(2Fe-2S) ferredoxin
MAPYERHIFICTGSYCDPDGQASAMYVRLAQLLGDLGKYNNPQRVKRGICPCLGICTNGPLLVVYPDGIWYHNVDDVLLKRIVQEHLRENRPVEEAIFYRMGGPLPNLKIAGKDQADSA